SVVLRGAALQTEAGPHESRAAGGRRAPTPLPAAAPHDGPQAGAPPRDWVPAGARTAPSLAAPLDDGLLAAAPRVSVPAEVRRAPVPSLAATPDDGLRAAAVPHDSASAGERPASTC